MEYWLNEIRTRVDKANERAKEIPNQVIDIRLEDLNRILRVLTRYRSMVLPVGGCALAFSHKTKCPYIEDLQEALKEE